MKIYWCIKAKTIKLEIEDKFDVNDIIEIKGINSVGIKGAMFFTKTEIIKIRDHLNKLLK